MRLAGYVAMTLMTFDKQYWYTRV